MGFNQCKPGHHLLCLVGSKFHASQASSSEGKIVIFSCVFLWLKPKNPGEDPY